MVSSARLLVSIYMFVHDAIERRRRIRESIAAVEKGADPAPPAPEPELPEASCDYLRAEHRRVERRSDRMRSALLRSFRELDPDVPAEFEQVRRLAAAHVEKERKVFYPRLQPAFTELLVELEEQHKQIGELERRVEESLGAPPEARADTWLSDVRARSAEYLDAVQRHFVREEVQLLREADKELSAEDQRRLAAEMNAV